MRRALVGALLLVAAVGAPALASYGDSATAASTLRTTQLAAPTGLTATGGCSSGLPKLPRVTLSWTATTSSFATGYDVYRAVGGGTQTLLTTLSPRTVTSYVDSAVLVATSYTYSVRTRYASWSKASSNASASTPVLCL
jgi:hypothetical protein